METTLLKPIKATSRPDAICRRGSWPVRAVRLRRGVSGVAIGLVFVLTLVLASVPGGAGEAFAAGNTLLSKLRRSVFKISVTSQVPDYGKPWKHRAVTTSTASGFYIGNGRILTNAHVVAGGRYITVRRDGDAQTHMVAVEFIGHDCDLAVLTPEDPKVLEGTAPLKFGDVPKLQSPVFAVGFPTGGDQLSITEGVVSRVSSGRYVHSWSHRHLRVQVDSAINPGNSGGPVAQRDRVVGVAFQTFTAAESTGYIIPTPVIRRFLKDIEDGRYDGHPGYGIEIASGAAMNPGTQAYYGDPGRDKGAVVGHIAYWSSLREAVKPGDLLLEIGKHRIGSDGRISFQGERVDLQVALDLRQIGDKIPIKLRRKDQTKSLVTEVLPPLDHYSTKNLYERYSRYFVYGGLVFTVLGRDFLRTWGKHWYRKVSPLMKYIHFNSHIDAELAKRSEFVLLAERLPHSVNTYLDEQRYGIVSQVDGKSVGSLEEMVQHLESSQGEFVRIDFLGRENPAVLRRSEVVASRAEILSYYGIDHDRRLRSDTEDGAIHEIPPKQKGARE